MITKADEYPIHQTAEPIAYSGTDRNFYDRFFFNGYSKTKELFFGAAMGVYPHINIKDAAFCVVVNGVQHNLRASAFLNMERMDTQVGPIGVDVVEPLKQIRLYVENNEYGIKADLVFTKNSAIVEEPRFTSRLGPRTLMDSTRMTQNGSWSGWIEIEGERIEVSDMDFVGTRDRSWGVRPIGAADPQPLAPAPDSDVQFFWFWAPLNFEDQATMFGLNEYADGKRWHQNAIRIPFEESAEAIYFRDVDVEYSFSSGTRHQKFTKLTYSDPEHGELTIEMKPRYHFCMSGLGYLHPEWNHGTFRGELDLGYDQIQLDSIDPSSILHIHIQAVVDATLTYQEKTQSGCGVLEQMILGSHYPTGLDSPSKLAP